MDKPKMESLNLTEKNIDKIAVLFPNVITETKDENGIVKKAINFELLKQELSDEIIDSGEECYDFTWVGKKASIVEGNKPIRKTLRPCIEESKNWETTENLYIEGDNLDVLKLLQESYLNKVKMIYIDPPYNTGNDFIYRDNFTMDKDEYDEQIGLYDEEENRMFQNSESNGRFHSDWCSMIYPRLKLAQNLLTDDGVIFISIDDNEVTNLTKICDEIFGESNKIGPIIQNKQNAKNDTLNVQKNHEFILVYRKQRITDETKEFPSLINSIVTSRDVFEENGEYYYLNDSITTRGSGGILNARPNLGYTVYYNPQTKDKIAIADYDIKLAKTSNDVDLIYKDDIRLISQGYVTIKPPMVRGQLGCWTWALDKFNKNSKDIIITGKSGTYSVRKRTFVDKRSVKEQNGKLQYVAVIDTNSRSILDFSTNDGTNSLNDVMGASNIFSNPKNLNMIKYLLGLVKSKDAITLDFFSGSATTVHAIMQLNAEDGGNRKFICVQLPEPTDEKTEAFKAGYKNICEIGKERIRRAGEKIVADNKDKENIDKLDIGFRVLKIDETNMKDVYYSANEYTQEMLDGLESNIKDDRTDMDLLYQVLLDWGLPLSLPHKIEKLEGVTVHTVNDGDLITCFDNKISETVIREIAKRQPMRVVFRDSSFESSPQKINVAEIFKLLAPNTTIKVI